MSALFEKIDTWRKFGDLTNSRLMLAFQGRFRGTVERLMLPLAHRQEQAIPLARPSRPLPEARVTLVTTTGVYLEGQAAFDTVSKMGDASFRIIPSGADVSMLRIAHTHFSHERAEKDINVIFPVETLRGLAGDGTIGSIAPSLYSYGFDLHTTELNGPRGSAREMARRMLDEGVVAALFTPG